jgi:Fe-S-cluster-containing hydrogenase component 2
MANEKQTNGVEGLAPKRDNGASQEKIRNGRNGRVNGVRTANDQEKEVSRRTFVVGTGAAAAGVVVGGMVGYGVSNGKVSSVDPFAAPFPTLWIGRSLETCTGCKLCEIACSQEKEGGVVWPAASRMKVYQYPPCVEFPVACYLCGPDAECIKGCGEVDALRWDAETSTIRVDTEKCLRTTSDMGCIACANACPGDAVFFHPTSSEPLFCDLCDGRLPCVEVCPTRAITARGVSGSASSPAEIAKHLGHMYDLPLSRTAEGEAIAAQPGQEG